MNGSEKISIIIAEGNNQFLDELVSWLSSEPSMDLVGTVGDGEGTVNLVRRHRPDIVFMDIHLPAGGGIEATEVITTLLPGTGVIMTAEDTLQIACGRRMDRRRTGIYLEERKSPGGAAYGTRGAPKHGGTSRLQWTDSEGSTRELTPSYATETKREGQIITLFSPKGGVGETADCPG